MSSRDYSIHIRILSSSYLAFYLRPYFVLYSSFGDLIDGGVASYRLLPLSANMFVKSKCQHNVDLSSLDEAFWHPDLNVHKYIKFSYMWHLSADWRRIKNQDRQIDRGEEEDGNLNFTLGHIAIKCVDAAQGRAGYIYIINWLCRVCVCVFLVVSEFAMWDMWYVWHRSSDDKILRIDFSDDGRSERTSVQQHLKWYHHIYPKPIIRPCPL